MGPMPPSIVLRKRRRARQRRMIPALPPANARGSAAPPPVWCSQAKCSKRAVCLAPAAPARGTAWPDRLSGPTVPWGPDAPLRIRGIRHGARISGNAGVRKGPPRPRCAVALPRRFLGAFLIMFPVTRAGRATMGKDKKKEKKEAKKVEESEEEESEEEESEEVRSVPLLLPCLLSWKSLRFAYSPVRSDSCSH